MSLSLEFEILRSCLPSGKIWEGKYKEEYYLYKLFNVFAGEFNKVSTSLREYNTEVDIWGVSIKTIEFWENLVGIPDDIFPKKTNLLTIEQRRNNVAIKLFGLKISSKTELRILLEKIFPELIGSGWQIINASSYSIPYTMPFLITGRNAKKTLIIALPLALQGESIPYTVPFTVGGSSVGSIIENIVKSLTPFNRNCVVKYF
jgi:hypothetical protein